MIAAIIDRIPNTVVLIVTIAVPKETESIESYLATTSRTSKKDENIKNKPGIPKHGNALQLRLILRLPVRVLRGNGI